MKGSNRKGIVLAGGTGSRLYPLTLGSSKQMLPVYDKPMIYYPMSMLMLADIRDILIISTSQDLPAFRRLLGEGQSFGMRLTYAEQIKPGGLAEAFLIGADFLAGSPAALILGDNLFFARDFTRLLESISDRSEEATIFAYRVREPHLYGVIEFDNKGRAISLEEKPNSPRSSYAVPGLYFYPPDVVEKARKLKPSARHELEITDLNRLYLESAQLNVRILGRSVAWFDTGTHASLLKAANFVAAIQKRRGLQIACLEEIAYNKGWLEAGSLEASIETMGSSSYADYLRTLVTGLSRLPRDS